MIRPPALAGAVVLAALLPAAGAAGEEAPPDGELNVRLQVTVIETDPGEEGPAGEVLAAFRAGRAVSCLVRVPGAAQPGGSLLDPESVRFSWNGNLLPSFAYYHHPVSGLAFAILEQDTVRQSPEGELSLTARLVGEEEPAAGWRLPVDLTGGLQDGTDAPARPEARTVTVQDKAGDPIGGAYFFGQSVEGLLTRSGPDGTVVLGRASVDPATRHHAWAAGYWTSRVNLLEDSRAVLRPAVEETARRLDVTVEDSDGAGISPVILDVEMGRYTVLEGSGPHAVTVPAEGDVRLVAVAAGWRARSVTVEEGKDSVRIVLEPLTPLPGEPLPE